MVYERICRHLFDISGTATFVERAEFSFVM